MSNQSPFPKPTDAEQPSVKGLDETPCWPSLEDDIAAALVAEYGELDKTAVKAVISKATAKHAQESHKRPGCCPDCAAEWMRPLPSNRWYCEECGVVKPKDGAGKTPREIQIH